MFETFTPEEEDKLRPFFTNLDKQVYALKNIDSQVAGMMFARYSRYAHSVRRLFLEEFYDDNFKSIGDNAIEGDNKRAKKLSEQLVIGYGDDSILATSGAHVCFENVSNIVTKMIERPRIGAAYLEKSSRYVSFADKYPNGEYRYYHDERLGNQYHVFMNDLFQTYEKMINKSLSWVRETYPRQDDQSEFAYNAATKAKALDLIRGILPMATRTNFGAYLTSQSYEKLIYHLLASPLPESQEIGKLLIEELDKVIPLATLRVKRPDRGGEWVNFLKQTKNNAQVAAKRLGITTDAFEGVPIISDPSVTLTEVYGSEQDIAVAMLTEAANVSELDIHQKIDSMTDESVGRLIMELVGDRKNRRYLASRGFEAVSYRFEVVGDIGSWRDLQRHRLNTFQWNAYTTHLGYQMPEELNKIGIADEFKRVMEGAHVEYERLTGAGFGDEAQYVVPMAYNIRYQIQLNARAAMQMLELRSGPTGHANYRKIAQKMADEIGKTHPHVRAAMEFIDMSEGETLERMNEEARNEAKRNAIKAKESSY